MKMFGNIMEMCLLQFLHLLFYLTVTSICLFFAFFYHITTQFNKFPKKNTSDKMLCKVTRFSIEMSFKDMLNITCM